MNLWYRVSDLDLARAFYARLGFEEVFRDEDGRWSRIVRDNSSTRARVRRAATHEAIGRTNGIAASNSQKSTSATSAGRDHVVGAPTS